MSIASQEGTSLTTPVVTHKAVDTAGLAAKVSIRNLEFFYGDSRALKSINLNGPMPSLPVVIFQFALSPYEEWQKLAWTGALLITVTVLALSIFARSLTAARKSQ